MDASEVTDTEHDLPPPRPELPPPVPDLPPRVVDSLPEESVDLTTTAVVRKLRRRAVLIMLLVWVVIIVGEVGYVIGRDRTASSPAAVRTEVGPGDLTVLQAIVRWQQNRIDALQSAANDALTKSQSPPTSAAPAVRIPLESFDPLGGATSAAYSGTLALAECDGFGDASACSAENHLAFTLARLADGSLALSSALFENAPVTRAGGVLHAQGPVANPTYVVACNGTPMATLFDAQLIPNQLTVTNGVPAVTTFSVTLAISAPPAGACPQRLQLTYQGTISPG